MQYIRYLLVVPLLFSFNKIFLNANECGTPTKKCDSKSIYYTIDGTCNNLDYPMMGSQFSMYKRMEKPRFGPDNTEPLASNGEQLPNERAVRKAIISDCQISANKYWTRLIIPMLQFMTHDISNLYLRAPFDACCDSNYCMLDPIPEYCAPISVSSDDIMNKESGVNCIPVTKSYTNQDLGCSTEQCSTPISDVTFYLDLSVLYGSNLNMSNSLRTFTNGYLKVSEKYGYSFLTCDNNTDNCRNLRKNECCHKSADDKVDQNPDLTTIHTLWLRNHNRIAAELSKLNPCWSDEKLFQTARKINIAQHQWMSIFEVITVLLGSSNVKKYGIVTSAYLGYADDYDKTCDASASVEHSQAAFRILHSMIREGLMLADDSYNSLGIVPLRDQMGHTEFFLTICKHFDNLIRGSATQGPSGSGPLADFGVVNTLFLKRAKFGMDLMAIDIKRGRVSGLPSYVTMKQKCGLGNATCWEDLEDLIDPKYVAILKTIYPSWVDVDLFVGLILETHAKDTVVGPTALCIIVDQMVRLRQCDRLWFEHKDSGFTLLQLTEIRLKSSIAGFICHNSNNIKKVQPQPLLQQSLTNFPISCDLYPKLDLTWWKDC